MLKKHIQLYSIKDEVFGDFEKSLRKVKEVGYDGVEFFGGFYGGRSASEMKKLLEEIGLIPTSSHITTAEIAAQVDYAAELGIEYLIDPMANFRDYEAALEFSKKLNEAGKLCKQKGIAFGYHNHSHEFLQGKDGYLIETVIKNTDPEIVCFQLDVGWATVAGANAVELLGKYPDRFKSIHFKECGEVIGPDALPDFSKFPKGEDGKMQIPPEVLADLQTRGKWNVAAGKGIIDWESVIKKSRELGIDSFIVEREHDYLGDIIACVKEDFEVLSRLLN